VSAKKSKEDDRHPPPLRRSTSPIPSHRLRALEDLEDYGSKLKAAARSGSSTILMRVVDLGAVIVPLIYYVLSGSGDCHANAHALAAIDYNNCTFFGGTEEHCREVEAQKFAEYDAECP